MSRRARDLFETVRSEGGLLPADLLKRIAAGDKDLKGLTPDDYHLIAGERLTEVISRAWNRLLGAWAAFGDARAKLAEGAPDAALTRDRWLLVLLQELGYGRLEPARAREIEGASYPISHAWGRVPIHLVGFRTGLDVRSRGVAGAARQSPHGMLQEFLNRSPEHLWGVVSNGLTLRLLRDNASLTRQAYVEVDLEAMLERQAYADFALLWLLAHQSRLEGERPEDCWLERWARTAQEQGTRALDRLRDGVTQAIAALGRGFLAHPRNAALRERLKTGTLDKQDYYRQLLRLVYRLLFLFVAEDRDLLLLPDAAPAARQRYLRFYSTARLRRFAERRRGSTHADLYRTLCVVIDQLGTDGTPALGLSALGSFLWSPDAAPDLDIAELANRDLLDAVRALAFSNDGNLLGPVDYRNLAAEELGSVYESLLELHPQINADAAEFNLASAGGHERKTTGSYYTPEGLVQCLLDSGLNPTIEERLAESRRQAGRDPAHYAELAEQALLSLRVCDPAVGSGHFLIAAGHRIAKRLAAVRSGDSEPPPEAMRAALRDVIGRCLFGVDVNEMAVELCKVSLWLEALEPGKPLSFLDHHIQCGNSLLGTTPALMDQGIPDEAFKALEGDDEALVAALKKQNRKEREGGQMGLPFRVADQSVAYSDLASRVDAIDAELDDVLERIRSKEARWRRLRESRELRHARLAGC